MAVVTVAFSELDAWLQAQPENTADTPYELNITGLTVSDVGDSYIRETLGYILRQNRLKYVDLSATELPSGLTILSDCFFECITLIKSPVIPDSVTDMNNCFTRCTLLTEAPVIPDSVTNISGCFYECTALTEAPIIPNSVTDMQSCFAFCTSITEAPIIPDSVTSIGGCFSGCTSLSKAPVIPDSVTNISGCFSDCTSITEAPVIPDSVTDMQSCFAYCTSLTEPPIIPDSVTNISGCFINCVLFTKPPVIPDSVTDMGGCFHGCTSLTEPPIIPDSVTNMDSCFMECTSLTEAPIIPDSVTNMDSCFMECTSLIKVPTIPKFVTAMEGCFEKCTSLTKLPVIPSSVTALRYCFFGCSSLTELTLENPANVTSYDYAFVECPALTTFKTDVPYTTKHWLEANAKALPKDKDVDEYTIETINEPQEISFSWLNDELSYSPENTVDTPYQIKVIDLTANNIGSSDTSDTLGYVIKQNSTKYIDLSVTTIPDSVTDMTECFDGCTTLVKSPAIPNSVTNMTECFNGCTSLLEVSSISNSVTNMSHCFEGCTSLTDIPVIPHSVTNMEFCFENCISLEEVILENPSNVTTFNYVFEGCTALITFKSDVIYTTKNWLETVKSVYPTYLPKEVDEYILETINNPPEIPFSWLNDELNNSPANTADTAYEIKVTELTTDDLVTSETSGTLGYVLNSNDTKYVDLSTTELPSSLTTLEYCFYNCTTLVKSPVIPDSVTDIDSCFSGCTGIVSIPNVPASVTSMESAFNGCTALEFIDNFEVPISVLESSNAQNAFNGCTALTEINVPNSTHIEEDDNWHLFLLDIGSDTVSGKVYDSTGESETIPSTAITKDKMKLTKYTDELLFSTVHTMAELEEIAEKLIEYKYGVYNKETIEPDKKSFVMYADDPDNVVTNIKFPADFASKGLDKGKTDNAIARWNGTEGKLQNSGVTIDDNNVISGGSLNNASNVAFALSNGVTCSTAAGTAAKTVALEGFVLRKGAKLLVNVVNTNTATGPLTLNVNGTGAKTIREGGKVTSATSHTLTAGWYNCYYDGTYWSMDNFYEVYNARISNQADYTRGTALCATPGATAAKVAAMLGYTLRAGNCFPITFLSDNTATSMTLNVNGTGAKPVYLNGQAVSSSNKTLNGGTYLCLYDGSVYHIGFSGASTAGSYGGLLKADKWSMGTSSGYIKFSNGLIMQWGYVVKNTSQDTTETITFPISYTQIPALNATWIKSGGYTRMNIKSISTSNCVIRNTDGTTNGYTWMSIGY